MASKNQNFWSSALGAISLTKLTVKTSIIHAEEAL